MLNFESYIKKSVFDAGRRRWGAVTEHGTVLVGDGWWTNGICSAQRIGCWSSERTGMRYYIFIRIALRRKYFGIINKLKAIFAQWRTTMGLCLKYICMYNCFISLHYLAILMSNLMLNLSARLRWGNARKQKCIRLSIDRVRLCQIVNTTA